MKTIWRKAGGVAAAIGFAFGCGVAEAAVPLSLSESVAMALQRDESIEAAEAGKNAAKWQLSAARRASGFNIGWKSSATTIGGANYQQARFYYNLGYTDDPYEYSYTNSLSAEFPLYTGGRIENNVEARSHGLSAASLTLENTKRITTCCSGTTSSKSPRAP